LHIPIIIATTTVLICIFLCKALYRFGVPSLIIFLALGMLMGSDSIGGIYFNDYEVAKNISYLAIVLIIFYGGFGTKWNTAKPMAVKAGLLSSLGTMVTAVATGLFCVAILQVPLMYGLLFGAVVASTDAASIFSILRSRKLNLKNGLAPLLEVESGSNDPFAYMLTILIISIIKQQGNNYPVLHLIGSIAAQVGIAAGIGLVMSFASIFILKRMRLEISGLYPIMLLAIVMLGFSFCEFAGGNGLLCVYILGMIVGNTSFIQKTSLIHFFDGLSWLMQILLFFILGLLSFPSHLPAILIPGTVLSLLIIFAARPLAVFSILSWFKVPIRQQILVSWAGIRGAASVVFAIMAIQALGDDLPYDLFHLVFFVALFSVLIQGSLTPFISNKLGLIDEDDKDNSVMKTFTAFIEEPHEHLLEHTVTANDKLDGKCLVDANLPEDVLIVMIKRGDKIIIPKGSTQVMENDILVVSCDDFSFFGK